MKKPCCENVIHIIVLPFSGRFLLHSHRRLDVCGTLLFKHLSYMQLPICAYCHPGKFKNATLYDPTRYLLFWKFLRCNLEIQICSKGHLNVNNCCDLADAGQAYAYRSPVIRIWRIEWICLNIQRLAMNLSGTDLLIEFVNALWSAMRLNITSSFRMDDENSANLVQFRVSDLSTLPFH